jgi:hypothetical protein
MPGKTTYQLADSSLTEDHLWFGAKAHPKCSENCVRDLLCSVVRRRTCVTCSNRIWDVIRRFQYKLDLFVIRRLRKTGWNYWIRAVGAYIWSKGTVCCSTSLEEGTGFGTVRCSSTRRGSITVVSGTAGLCVKELCRTGLYCEVKS